MKGLTPICPYCKKFSKAVGGNIIYPHRDDLAHLNFFKCDPCDAYVGTHRNTGKPLGTLANATLRKLRNATHAVFDPLWFNAGKGIDQAKGQREKRTEMYAWLCQSMGLRPDECHIAMFNEERCLLAIKLCREKPKE
jgi:Protein of unknown function (DUF3268).